MAENWLSKKIKNLGKSQYSHLDKAVDERVAAVDAALAGLPAPEAAAYQTLATGDDVVNYYKQALFGATTPQDIMYGGQLIGFEPATGTGELPVGYPAELYQQMLKHSPKFRPVARKKT